MKKQMKHWQKKVALAGITLTLTSMPAMDSLLYAANGHGNNGNLQVMPPGSNPFGKSYSEWSGEWWKWLLRLPATDHPAFSLDGANCGEGQSGKVWFLTGAFTNEYSTTPNFNTIIREACTVPTGKAIFFPIVNAECSTVEGWPYQLIETGPDQNTDTCAAKFIDGTFQSVAGLSVTIDGRSLNNLEAYRAQSPVFSFSFADPTDNMLGADCSAVDCTAPHSISDGYWIMLQPLSRGDHTVRFTGSFVDPNDPSILTFGMDVTYELTVAGGNK